MQKVDNISGSSEEDTTLSVFITMGLIMFLALVTICIFLVNVMRNGCKLYDAQSKKGALKV